MPGFHQACVYDVICMMIFCSVFHATVYPIDNVTEGERAVGDLLRFCLFCHIPLDFWASTMGE